MIVTRDFRTAFVNVQMGLTELRETVEWLEAIAPDDGATKDWRKELDRVDPPEVPE